MQPLQVELFSEAGKVSLKPPGRVYSSGQQGWWRHASMVQVLQAGHVHALFSF